MLTACLSSATIIITVVVVAILWRSLISLIDGFPRRYTISIIDVFPRWYTIFHIDIFPRRYTISLIDVFPWRYTISLIDVFPRWYTIFHIYVFPRRYTIFLIDAFPRLEQRLVSGNHCRCGYRRHCCSSRNHSRILEETPSHMALHLRGVWIQTFSATSDPDAE
jgi:hypothetical protein